MGGAGKKLRPGGWRHRRAARKSEKTWLGRMSGTSPRRRILQASGGRILGGQLMGWWNSFHWLRKSTAPSFANRHVKAPRLACEQLADRVLPSSLATDCGPLLGVPIKEAEAEAIRTVSSVSPRPED